MRNLVTIALQQIVASAGDGIWQAHRGCAALAGVLLLHDDLVAPEARGLIDTHIRTTLHGCDAPDGKEASLQFDRFARYLLDEIALDAREPKELGHDVIYTAYILRALDAFSIPPWRALLEGVRTLLRAIRASGPGWITVNGVNEPRAMLAPPGTGAKDAWSSFAGLERPRSMELGDMQLGHLLTHGHAISMLRRYTSLSLAGDLVAAHQRRLRTLQAATLEERDTTPLRRMAFDPRSPAYWKWIDTFGDMHGHALKYAYSFLDLRRDGVATRDCESFSRIVWPAHPASAFA